MKLVRVTIKRGNPALGEPQMIYPAGYNPVEVDMAGPGASAIKYGYTGFIGAGGTEEALFILLEDSVADRYGAMDDMDVVETVDAETEIEEARVHMGKPAEIVDDLQRLQAIAVKQQLNIPLTTEDQQALDPDDLSVRGIRRYEKVSDILTKTDAVQIKVAELAQVMENIRAAKRG